MSCHSQNMNRKYFTKCKTSYQNNFSKREIEKKSDMKNFCTVAFQEKKYKIKSKIYKKFIPISLRMYIVQFQHF